MRKKVKKKMSKNIHVVYDAEAKNWSVKQEGCIEMEKSAKLKADAVKLGRAWAKEEKVELVIHNRNGKISDKDSFGNDPKSSVDKVH